MSLLSSENGKLVDLAKATRAEDCSSPYVAFLYGEAFARRSDESNCLLWLSRSYSLNPSDESLGAVLSVAFSNQLLECAESLIAQSNDISGYYYLAGKYELAFRMTSDEEKVFLEEFLEYQDEDSYLLRLAWLNAADNNERAAKKACKKIIRLYSDTETSEYAEILLSKMENSEHIGFIESNPVIANSVFNSSEISSIIQSYENAAKNDIAEMREESRAGELATDHIKEAGSSKLKHGNKKNDSVRIASAIESCMVDIVGMQDLKTSLNTIFNSIQAAKKRSNSEAIIKNNLIIFGEEGCGKTTAASVVAHTLYKLGMIEKDKATFLSLCNLWGGKTKRFCQRFV